MWNDPKSMNIAALILAFVSAVAILSASMMAFARQPMFMFRKVEVSNVSRADFAHIANVVRREIKGTFFTQDLNLIRSALKKVPWVKTAGLYRQWPNRLGIAIEEYVPFATWNDTALVTEEGTVFYAPYNGELPTLRGGRDEDAGLVVENFKAWREKLATKKTRLSGVTYSSRGSWSLMARDAQGEFTIELGKDAPVERLDRMLSVYPQTVGALRYAGQSVSAIDCRYKDGLAVRLAGQTKK
jgi:cell division protein FtsQ